MRHTLTVAATVAVLAASSAAHALEVQTQVSSRRVGVGESFFVQLVVYGDSQAALTDARLPLPPGMTTSRPSASQSSQVSIVNGQMTQRVGYTLSWTVTASQVGKFTVGPPSVSYGGEAAKGRSIQIEVVAGGTSGGPGVGGTRRGFDPFDFLDPSFGRGNMGFPPGFMRSPFDDDEPPPEPEVPQYPPELRVDKAPDPLVFMRATLAPTQAVVGQQVMLRVYVYTSRNTLSTENVNEPSHADFLAIEGNADQPKFYAVPIGGTRFAGAKFKELALFPLRAGTLRAGGMKATFTGRGYTDAKGNPARRESNWADVIVTEPPLQGRPPGYKIGDVGDYTLSATVEPRQIVAGEAVSVVVKLSGVGNVPYKVQTPESHGVEWLEPSLSEKISVENGLVQGSRTFNYVVKLSDAGTIDLGEITLPFYDAKKRAYNVARAVLGNIDVKPNPNAPKQEAHAKPNDRLAGLMQPRATLGAAPAQARPLADRPGFWAVLLLAPFGMVLTGGALSALGHARTRLRERGASLPSQLDAALREARSLATSDTQRAVSAVERAVFLAIELKLGFKARAVLKTDLGRALIERGLPSARADALSQLLQDCDTVRFVGSSSGIEPAQLAQRAAQQASEMRSEKLADRA